jgi:hypothetical protein
MFGGKFSARPRLQHVLLFLACTLRPALTADDEPMDTPVSFGINADGANTWVLPTGTGRRRMPYSQRQPAILDVGALFGQITITGATHTDTRPPARLQAGSRSYLDAGDDDDSLSGSASSNDSANPGRSTRWLKSKTPRSARNPASPHAKEHHHAARTLLVATRAVDTLSGAPPAENILADAQGMAPGLEPWTMGFGASAADTLERALAGAPLADPRSLAYSLKQGEYGPLQALAPFLSFPGESLESADPEDGSPMDYITGEVQQEELYAKVRRTLLQEPTESLPILAGTPAVPSEVGAPSGGPANGSESGEVAAPLATWLRRIVDTGEDGAQGPEGGTQGMPKFVHNNIGTLKR